MSISQQQLEQIFQYLANFWQIDYGVVVDEYGAGLFTCTEDPDDPSKVNVDHRDRDDIVILLEEL